MQRIRIRYTKEGRVRFVSARDLTAVWERALRRADLPIAYSEGYTPHAKVSFPDALPVGYASTGEYAELTFAATIDPGPALGRCSATLPDGMDILTYLDVPDGAPKLARMLRVTCWELVYPAADPAADTIDALRRLGERLRDADHVAVTRHRPDGDRVLDVPAGGHRPPRRAPARGAPRWRPGRACTCSPSGAPQRRTDHPTHRPAHGVDRAGTPRRPTWLPTTRTRRAAHCAARAGALPPRRPGRADQRRRDRSVVR